MKVRYLALACVTFSIPFVHSACSASGSDTSSGGTGTDSGTGTGSDSGGGFGSDSGGGSNTDGGTDGGSQDLGTQIKAGTSLSIQGVTTDGYIVYTNTTGATTTLEVISAAGGAAATVLSSTFNPSTDFALTDGMTAAFWTGVSATTGQGTFGYWSKAAGLKAAQDTKSLAGLYSSSTDGTRVAFSANAAADSSTTDFKIGDAAGVSLTTPAQLATIGFGTNAAACNPQVSFVADVLYAAVCPGANSAKAGVFSFSAAATPAVTTLAAVATTQAPFWFTVPGATDVLLLTTAGALSERVATAASAAKAIDTTVADAVMSSDGKTALYLTSAGALKSADLTVAALTKTALTTGLMGMVAQSPDFKYTMGYALAVDQTNQNVPRIDIQLASNTTAAGTLTALLATSTGEPVGFNSTSTYAYYMTDLPATGGPVGTLRARGVAAASTEKSIATGALEPTLVDASTKVVFGANLVATATSASMDLQEGDATGTTAPATIVTAVDVSYGVTGGKAVFTVPGQGLYAKTLP